jgi:hypothetical protein
MRVGIAEIRTSCFTVISVGRIVLAVSPVKIPWETEAINP